jgi:hypothetical protein
MNKRTIVASLNEIANELDSNGLFKEANEVTEIMVKISQYSGLKPGSSAANAVGVNPPIATGAGSAIATPGYIAVNDSEAFNYHIGMIEMHLGNGDPQSASDEYLKGLKALKSNEAKTKFSTKWNRLKKNYGVGVVDEEPTSGTTTNTPVSPNKPVPANKPNVGKKPGAPSTKPSAPGKPVSKTPTNTDGLDRWINKAENIYKAWGQKGANPNSSAFGLVKDIVDYMQKVKSNLPTSLHGQADAKIAKVQGLLGDIFDGNFNPAFTPITLPYSSISGYPKKGVDPFGRGPRLEGKALDYQARQESKSY